ARRENIVGELTRLARESQPRDLVVIYFAGHGVRARWSDQASKAQHSYWLAYDTTLARLEIEGLRLEHAVELIDDIPSTQKLVILDHCHSGTIELPKSGESPGRDAASTLAVRRDLVVPDNLGDQFSPHVKDSLLVLGSATDFAYELPELKHGL